MKIYRYDILYNEFNEIDPKGVMMAYSWASGKNGRIYVLESV